MKTAICHHRSAESAAISLPVVLVLTGLSLLVLGSTMNWTSSSAHLTDRQVNYYNAVAAAEAATEKVISYMFRDFRDHAVLTNLDLYRTNIPMTPELADRFEFLDSSSNMSKITILPYHPHGNTNNATNLLDYGYKIIANARSTVTPEPVSGAVRQIVTFSNDPIFRYAIYYSLDLEFHPSPPMTIIGRVHCQNDIYYSADNTLTFLQNVTAVGLLHNERKYVGKDQYGTINYPPPPHVFMAKAPSKSLPVGTNNSPEAVHAILEKPPVGEDKDSQMGKQRYYNNVDMILTVTSSNMVARTGPRLVSQTIVTNGLSFVSTNASFYNGRENKTVSPTDINIGNLNTWINNAGNPINSIVQSERGHIINSIYVEDLRKRPSGQGSGVRVNNGRYLPSAGLTVATEHPIYVEGHYNAPNLATTNTVNTRPASLAGDAITVLSEGWSDSANQTGPNNTTAQSTTVNAAFLAGIVETVGPSNYKYSGGVENFPRFLENWGSGRPLTYNGSMVVMFPSRYATNYWKRADNKTYYTPPKRDWTFDVNFLNPNKLPPCTPQMRTLVRDRLEIVRAFSTD
ncbi:MAG TPA: hypothetical protein P5186_11505 [Candidatus Paceibacterota bacterium]|nr:hypothetical protein [Verrucomicrobiota bacterium]HRY48666.1 hypothetical protein [Candidatus Paceibacterota bacterium]HSA01021.1 hypothetical protein [Candidatus Paceibacterota bacterium]